MLEPTGHACECVAVRGAGISAAACALEGAVRVQRAARRVGFDWDDPADALDKVREETEEVAAAMGGAVRANSPLADELGDLLFAVTNVARMTGVDPAAALVGATARFESRFAEVRRIARLRGLPMPGTPLPELDRIWEQVKAGIG